MKLTAMDKGFLLIVMEISIQMFAEDLPCLFVQLICRVLNTARRVIARLIAK